jgi:hypothetical protein
MFLKNRTHVQGWHRPVSSVVQGFRTDGRDSIEWGRPQNIVRRPSNDLKTNRDDFLDRSDDTGRDDIAPKILKDDIGRRTDEERTNLDEIWISRDHVTGFERYKGCLHAGSTFLFCFSYLVVAQALREIRYYQSKIMNIAWLTNAISVTCSGRLPCLRVMLWWHFKWQLNISW